MKLNERQKQALSRLALSGEFKVVEEIFEALFRELDDPESILAAASKDGTTLEGELAGRVRAKQIIRNGFLKLAENAKRLPKQKPLPDEYE